MGSPRASIGAQNMAIWQALLFFMSTCPKCSASVPAGAKSCPACYQLLSDATSYPSRGHSYREGVTISDIDIPFGRLVAILFKLWLASIPVLIATWVLMAFVGFLFFAIFASSVLMAFPKH